MSQNVDLVFSFFLYICPCHISIFTFQIKKFTRNKVIINANSTSYDSLGCVLSISIIVKPIPITER